MQEVATTTFTIIILTNNPVFKNHVSGTLTLIRLVSTIAYKVNMGPTFVRHVFEHLVSILSRHITIYHKNNKFESKRNQTNFLSI